MKFSPKLLEKSLEQAPKRASTSLRTEMFFKWKWKLFETYFKIKIRLCKFFETVQVSDKKINRRDRLGWNPIFDNNIFIFL